jgi:hypothetical protein
MGERPPARLRDRPHLDPLQQPYWAIDRIVQYEQTWIAAKSMIYYQVDIVDRSVAIV